MQAHSSFAFWNSLDFFFLNYFWSAVDWIHGGGTCGYGGLSAKCSRLTLTKSLAYLCTVLRQLQKVCVWWCQEAETKTRGYSVMDLQSQRYWTSNKCQSTFSWPLKWWLVDFCIYLFSVCGPWACQCCGHWATVWFRKCLTSLWQNTLKVILVSWLFEDKPEAQCISPIQNKGLYFFNFFPVYMLRITCSPRGPWIFQSVGVIANPAKTSPHLSEFWNPVWMIKNSTLSRVIAVMLSLHVSIA